MLMMSGTCISTNRFEVPCPNCRCYFGGKCYSSTWRLQVLRWFCFQINHLYNVFFYLLLYLSIDSAGIFFVRFSAPLPAHEGRCPIQKSQTPWCCTCVVVLLNWQRCRFLLSHISTDEPKFAYQIFNPLMRYALHC